MTVGIVATRAQSYLLFHSLAETFSIVTGLTVFSIVWNTRRTLDSPFLLVVGLASGPTALVDLVHMLSFKGMGVFASVGTNLSAQLWLSGRTVEICGIVTAVAVGHRRPRPAALLVSFSALAAGLLLSVFALKVFPTCFVEGKGLTPFKKVTEFVFVGLMILAFAGLRRRRALIPPTLYPYLSGVVLLIAVQESCFAFFTDPDGPVNMAGHIVKIAIFYLIYSGVVRFGFTEPQEILFHSMSDLNRRLMATSDELRASREWLQRITDSLSEGVIVIAVDGTVRFANPAAERLLTSRRQTLHRDADQIDDYIRLRDTVGEHALRASPFWAALSASGAMEADGVVFVLPDGRTLEVSCSASAMTDDHGSRETILSFRDMGALNQARRHAAQEAHLAAIGRLAAGIAHEINTPAQYLRDNLTFLQHSFLELVHALPAGPGASSTPDAAVGPAGPDLDFLVEEIPRALQQSSAGVQRIAGIVKAMKTFAYPSGERPEPADLPSVITSAVEVSRHEWARVSEVEVSLDPRAGTVTCHRDRLGQVMLNLLVNAAHAITEAHGQAGTGRIRISTRRDGDWVEIQIADNGCGLQPDLQQRVFDPFFTTKPVGRGTGQGLTIVHDIVVNLHHGQVHLDSEVGVGTTFTVRLPCQGAPDPD
jgi:signal transduction histidine kinase